jgi:hypothetical protein
MMLPASTGVATVAMAAICSSLRIDLEPLCIPVLFAKLRQHRETVGAPHEVRSMPGKNIP